jgi:uncharacterized protein YndB with AHSA1/START domain
VHVPELQQGSGSVAKRNRFVEEDERTIVITRVFDAPRALVFKAWTDPTHVAQWWGPKGFTNPACEMDLRVGGAFRLHMRGPDGATYPCTGTYREIAEPERIVYAGEAEDGHPCGAGLPPRSLVTVTFAERDGKTTVTIHTRLQTVADRDAAVKMGFDTGWASSLDRLAEHLLKV